MASRRAQRTTILRAGIATLLLGTVLAVTSIAISPASAYEPDPENHKIEICHATGSADTPYTTPSPAKWQITSPNGHGYLPDDGSHDEDIIPPFPAGEHGGQSWGEYGGQNWTEETEAFYDAGCGEPETGPRTGDVTLAKVLAGDAIPTPAPTDFEFTVECDSGVVTDASPTIVAGADPVAVATDVELDDTCTITETVPAGAVVSFDVGTPGTSSTTVTVASTNGVDVTATNTFTSTGCTSDCGGPDPEAALTASRRCGTGGILITVSNAGDAPGAANILSGMDQPFSHAVHVLAGDTDEVLVPIAEDSDYLITVTDVEGAVVATFRGPKDCVEVGGIVVPPTPTAPVATPVDQTPAVQPVVSPAVEVAGVVHTRELPRTGADTLPLAQLGAALVLVGAAVLIGSRRLELA